MTAQCNMTAVASDPSQRNGLPASFNGEVDRIRREYARRAREIPVDFYSLTRPANLFHWQQRSRHALALLQRCGMLPLDGRRVLEVGCGEQGWLGDLESWGVRRRDLAGIDLDPQRIDIARRRFGPSLDESGQIVSPGADLHCGNAAGLPWADAQFDIVVQSTVFTSILDWELKRAIASDLMRVLKPRGVVLWYDFFVDNPRNPNVRGVGRREIATLFKGCEIVLERVTLAPPVARRLVPLGWGLAMALEALKLLNTHYLCVIRKR